MKKLSDRPSFLMKPIFEGVPTMKDDGYQFFRSEGDCNRVERDLLVKLIECGVEYYYIMADHNLGKVRSLLAIGFPHNAGEDSDGIWRRSHYL